eukprot:scaffold1602_cov129-Skeletonema_marinoi.AAC.7
MYSTLNISSASQLETYGGGEGNDKTTWFKSNPMQLQPPPTSAYSPHAHAPFSIGFVKEDWRLYLSVILMRQTIALISLRLSQQYPDYSRSGVKDDKKAAAGAA